MTLFRHDDDSDFEEFSVARSFDEDADSEESCELLSYHSYYDNSGFEEQYVSCSYYDSGGPEESCAPLLYHDESSVVEAPYRPFYDDCDIGELRLPPEYGGPPPEYDEGYRGESCTPLPYDGGAESASSRDTLSWRRILVEWAIILVVASGVATGIALLAQAFVLKPFLVPSSSMANTIEQNNRVLVDCVTFRLFGIHRDDIIVFKVPDSVSNTPLCKRVIGLPGDTLSLRNDRVYVNGHPLNEPYLRLPNGSLTPTTAAPNYGTPSDPWSLEQPYTVPAGRYFVMGDNRTKSDDSRYWGTVPRSALIGRVVAIYWPPSRIRIL